MLLACAAGIVLAAQAAYRQAAALKRLLELEEAERKWGLQQEQEAAEAASSNTSELACWPGRHAM